MTDFYSRHGCLDPHVFRPIYERAKVRGAGKLLSSNDPSIFTDFLIELYEASFNLNADTIRQRLKQLESVHQRLVKECRNLPEGSRALRQLQDEILDVEAKMDQAEGDLINVATAVREAQAEVARVRASMEEAKKAISSDMRLRAKAEKLRGMIHQINVQFEPTGRKYPKSRAVEVELVPKLGEPAKYRTDALLWPAACPARIFVPRVTDRSGATPVSAGGWSRNTSPGGRSAVPMYPRASKTATGIIAAYRGGSVSQIVVKVQTFEVEHQCPHCGKRWVVEEKKELKDYDL